NGSSDSDRSPSRTDRREREAGFGSLSSSCLSMLRGALLGAGNVAVHGHLPAWRERDGVQIVAVADAREDRRAAAVEEVPAARTSAAAEELPDRETLDFVDICPPPATHARLARASLERSVHVLCEKPLVVAPDELRGLPALAADRERTLFTVHNW